MLLRRSDDCISPDAKQVSDFRASRDIYSDGSAFSRRVPSVPGIGVEIAAAPACWT